MDAIVISKLTKEYLGGKKALDKLSLTVKSGEIFTLLGPNGAGKSTLINTLNTYQKPTKGEVMIMGKDLKRNQNEIRAMIACVAQNVSIDDHLSLSENMLFQSKLYKMDPKEAKLRMEKLMEVFELRDYSKALVAHYSGGIKRRLDIAMSLIPNPKILFLDEPTVGLDIESRKALWDMIRKIKQDYGITVFLTTHYLEEADMLSDNICIIKEGHELVQGSPDRLRDYTNRNMIRISLGKLENSSEIIRLLESQPFVKGIRNEEQILFVSVLDCMRDFKVINSILINKEIMIDSIEVVKPSLDDVFLTILNSVERSA